MKFQPGQSGNPAGRPPGSLNKKTIALEEAFAEQAEEVLQEVIARAKDGEKAAMRLCMERMLAPKRERTVVIDLPVIETPADARKALAVVTQELSEGNITITEATRLVGLIQRMLRAVGQIAKMEQPDREAEEAQERERWIREALQTVLAPDESSEAPPEAAQADGPADPSLYFPVNSENAGGAEGLGAASDSTSTREPSDGPPLARAA